MTDQDVLRKALNEIDSLRYRWGWTFGIMAAISQAAWIALLMGTQVGQRQAATPARDAGARVHAVRRCIPARAPDFQDDAQAPAGD